LALDDFRRAKVLQPRCFFGTAGGGDDAVAALRENRDRETADPAIGAGHEDVAGTRDNARAFQRLH
jgi:hypothetical protein